jgi:tetratricopeptide (TPR) repeat protein
MPAPIEPADSAEEVGPEPELAAEPDVAPEIEVASEPELAPEPEFPPEPELAPESEVAPEFEVAPKAERVPALEAAPEPAAAPQSESPAAAEDSGVLPGRAHEDLEEAEFYFQQGMHEEAETLYRRILATTPNHPQAQLRLGELASRRKSGGRGLGPDDDRPLDVVAPAAAEAPSTPRSRPRPSQADDLGMELPDDLVDPFAGLEDEELPAPQETVAVPAPAAGEATEAGDDLFGLVEVEDAPAAAPEPDPAEQRTPVRPAPFQAETTARDGELPGALFAKPLADPASEEASSGDEASGFDLAAALSDAFEPHEGDAGTAGATTEEEGFQEVFQAFKRGVSETLGEGDGEARYDLGIAYREMGLLEDAVAEFRSAAAEPSRRLESLHMLSLCMLDLGDARGALTHLEEALAHPGLEEIQQASLRFELGRVYEALEQPAKALDAYRAVAQVEPDFQDLAQRLATLEGSGTVSPAPEQSLESFEDLVVDGEADAEEAESEPAEVADASGTRQPVPDAEAEAPEPAQAETIGEDLPPAPEMPMADAPVPETVPETSLPPVEAAAEVPSEPEAPEPPETEGSVEPAAPGDEDPGTEPPKRSARTRRKKISFF